ncbi:unnamed protein product [Effrenium voratum]|uniref:Uncharacterized protein n=1 Tax=Effrenium voratum TaxID=2562239 RepID=A0AA36NDP8_9DINO|nr:unnamed protein product [Effrenium voratum]CAJ1442019.1 unnamed protein product [Effrenium voratum]
MEHPIKRRRKSAVLFLDLDGVLHSVEAPEEEFFNPEALLQLLRVVKAADARVVLSSSWRLKPQQRQQATEALGAFDELLRPSDATKDLRDREAEIQTWLQENKAQMDRVRKIELEVWPKKDWLVLDDLPLDLPLEHLVRTDPFLGLTAGKADEAIEKLRSMRQSLPVPQRSQN